MEEDKTILLIQLVQGRPTLYARGSDFRGRPLHWKQIATVLKNEVSWVKSRWHMLRSKFLEEYVAHLQGRRSNFKYFDEMSFLVDHVDIDAFEKHSKRNEFISHPEFVIEKKDLEAESDDESNIFLELELEEEEEEENKETEQIAQSFDLTEDVSQDCDEEPLLYEPNHSFSENQNQHSTKAAGYKLNSEDETIPIGQEADNKDSATAFMQKNTKNASLQESTNEPKASLSRQESVCTSKEDDALQPKSNKINEGKKSSLENGAPEKHRCEDTIFGELVAATLRKMDNEKKKSVKREIMNILFT